MSDFELVRLGKMKNGVEIPSIGEDYLSFLRRQQEEATNAKREREQREYEELMNIYGNTNNSQG